MPDAPKVYNVTLGTGGIVSMPVDIVRMWGLEGERTTLYFLVEGKRVVIVRADELPDYLAERAERESQDADRSA